MGIESTQHRPEASALALRTDRPQIVAATLATCLYCQGEPTGCPDCLHLVGPPGDLGWHHEADSDGDPVKAQEG